MTDTLFRKHAAIPTTAAMVLLLSVLASPVAAGAEETSTVKLSESNRTATAESGTLFQLAVAHADQSWGIIASAEKGVAYLSLARGPNARWGADEWRIGQEVFVAQPVWNKRAKRHEIELTAVDGLAAELDFDAAKARLLEELQGEEKLELERYEIWRVGNRVRLEGQTEKKHVSAAIGILSGTIDFETRQLSDSDTEPLPIGVEIPLTNDADAVTPLTLRAAGLRECAREFTVKQREKKITVVGSVQPTEAGVEMKLRKRKDLPDAPAQCIEAHVQSAFFESLEPVNFQIAFVPTRLDVPDGAEGAVAGHQTKKKRKARELRVIPGEPTIKGMLDEDRVTRVMTQRLRELRSCHEKALGTNSRASGKLVLSFTIAASGRITRARVATGSFDEKLDACIVEKMKRWVFPKP